MQQKKKSKAKMGYRETKLDSARQFRGIFFIEPNDEEFKLTMKAARRKLEFPMPAAMPCKIPIKSSGKPTAILGNARQNTLVLLMPTKAGAGHKHHQDHITAKGTNSMTHYSFVRKFIPMPQPLEISRCKSSSGEKMGKTEENSGMAADESQK